MNDTRTGQSYADGLRINGQHCALCGTPTSIRQPMSVGRVEPLLTTTCCGFVPCYGYVVVSGPWTATASSDRRVWACCLGLAERHLGEQAWLNSPTGASDTEVQG